MSSPQDATFAEILRKVYLRRSTGSISFDDDGDQYFFKDGELYVPAEHPLAEAVHARLAVAPEARPAEDEELRRLTSKVLSSAIGREAEIRFDGGTERFPLKLLGPLTTVTAVMELSVSNAGPEELTQRLGGCQAKYQNHADSPAMQQLPGLEVEMVQLMAHLETATPVESLLKLHPGRHERVLIALTKLRAIGLVTGGGGRTPSKQRRRRADAARDGESQVLSARSLELFSERIAEDLQARPLNLPADEHRQRLAYWLQHHAGMTHYELLRMDPRDGDDLLHQHYRELARQVHPIHIEPLRLQGRGEALRLLFERVTEAYLILSDPRRRAGYDLIIGTPVEEKVDEQKRREEKQRMAASCYGNALHYLSEQVRDYGQAADLLREAVRLDPQAGYLSMLGQALAHNPKWINRSVEAFEKAIELNPRDAGIRVAYADVLEKSGQGQAAKVQFEAALDDMPNHPLALRGLERLARAGKVGEAGAKLSGLRSFFKKSEP